MRQDPPDFALLNESEAKEPRYVIAIEFDVESVYLTSHEGITGVPGVVIENVLQRPSSISQRIVPDEGRTEIGSFSFSLVDLDSAFTEEISDKLLNDFKGLRDHRVRFYVGYRQQGLQEEGGFGSGGFGEGGFGEGAAVGADYPDSAFADFQLFQTQDITGVKFKDGVYTVQCADITREERKEVFEPKRTTLQTSIDASATTIQVQTTSGFTPIQHGTSYSDAASSFVGYIKIDKEIIRYTGKTADTFTGCTRGALNTKAVAHAVDAAITDNDRKPKVEEYIYLEMPAPMMAYAILTGIVKQTPETTLPEHWHLGIDPDLVRLTDFQTIGPDLWNTSDHTQGFIPIFQGLTKTDGKRFIEQELYQLIGCYGHVYYDGQLGLKRMNPVLADAAAVAVLDETNVDSWGDLDHDYRRVHNSIRVDWNWDGENYTRTTLFVDAESIETHGRAPLKTFQFKGLRGTRHTDALVRQRIDSMRDRYTAPPETIPVTVLPSLNRLEVGDIVRLVLANVRDFAGNQVSIDRSFEIQRANTDHSTGNLVFDLFGSTGRSGEVDPTEGAAAALPDAFYDAAGTELSTILTIVGGVVQAGSYTLNGTADLTASGSIFYYEGDLVIADGVTITITGNVQLRIRGFLTLNGDIDGIGGGQTGVADVADVTATPIGLSGYVGNSRGMDGLTWSGSTRAVTSVATRQARITVGRFSSAPHLELAVVGNTLQGLPTDLRGTSGGPGEKVVTRGPVIVGNGGTGADSGAGLAIICRGMAPGASGSIDLSGEDSAATSVVSSGIPDSFAGAGGAGGPGTLYVILDGASLSFPDLGGKFFGLTGSVPLNGNPIQQREKHQPFALLSPPYAGFLDPALISDVDLSDVCYHIQRLEDATAVADQDEFPPAPTALQVTGQIGFNAIRATLPAFDQFDYVEYYASSTNNRPDATLIATGKLTEFTHELAAGATRYYWVRTARIVDGGRDKFSDWLPSSATAGVEGIRGSTQTADIAPDAATELATFSVGTGLSVIAGSANSIKRQIAVTVTPSVTCEVIVRASFMALHDNAAGTATAVAYLSLPDYSSTVSGQSQTIVDVAPGGSYTVEGRFDVTGGTQYSAGVILDATSSRQITPFDITLVVEIIKR